MEACIAGDGPRVCGAQPALVCAVALAGCAKSHLVDAGDAPDAYVSADAGRMADASAPADASARTDVGSNPLQDAGDSLDAGHSDGGVDFGFQIAWGIPATCPITGSTISYYVDSLSIPSPIPGDGRTLGVDLDLERFACGWPDRQVRIDNGLIDLADALRTLPGAVDLYAAIDDGICIRSSGAATHGLRIDVAEGDECATVSFYRESDGALLASFPTGAAFGLAGRAPRLPFTLPMVASDDRPDVDVTLDLNNFNFVVGTFQPGVTMEILLAGFVTPSDVEAMVSAALTQSTSVSCPGPDCVTYDGDLAHFVEAYFDLANEAGECGSDGFLSVGLVGTACTMPVRRPCAP